MAEITLKDFKGMNLKEGLWDQGFAAYCQSFDFYGLGDDQTNISYGGVLQGALSLSSIAVSTAGVNLSAVVDMAWLDTTSFVYGIDITNKGRLYKFGMSSITVDQVASNNWRMRNICLYNQLLFITSAAGSINGQTGAITTYDGTSFTEGAFTGLYSADPMPMKVFKGYLFVANYRFVDRYDGSTYLAQKLTLPNDFNIRSIEVFKDGLYISADNGQYSRIFIWDGSSATFSDSILLAQEAYAPTLIAAQGILWAIGNRGGDPNDVSLFTALTPIYIFQDGQPDLIFELPLKRNRSYVPTTGVAAYQNGILIGSCEKSVADYENGSNGAWFIGKDLATGLFHASNMFGFVPSSGSVTVAGIYSSGSTTAGGRPIVYMSVSGSGTSPAVVQVASPSVSDNIGRYGPIWTSLPIDAGSTKMKVWTGMRVNFEPMTVAGQQVLFDIRLDNPNSAGFTNIKTFTYSASDSTTSPYAPRMSFIPIGRTARTIAVRIRESGGSSTPTVRIHSVTLYYDLLDQ